MVECGVYGTVDGGIGLDRDRSYTGRDGDVGYITDVIRTSRVVMGGCATKRRTQRKMKGTEESAR